MMPETDTEFARRLRARRAVISGTPERVIAERAGVARSAIYQALHAGQNHPPAWNTAEAIIRALGGEPEEYREAWEAARAGVLLTPLEQALIDLDVMRADLSGRLAVLDREMLAAGEIPGAPVAEYRFGVDQGRAALWHAVDGCGAHWPLSEGPEFLSSVMQHQREVHPCP
jgi:hypothetical protein